MFRLRKPPPSLICFLLFVVATGAAIGQAANAAGLAAFFFFVASIDPKPAWKFWYGKQGNMYDGRGWRFSSWQRVDVTSPKDLRKLPDLRN